MVSDLLGYVPPQLKPDEDREPWTIVFARQQPITVTFADGGFSFTLRGQQFFKGDKPYPGMNVTAAYKFAKANGVLQAVRQGELEVFPPNFVPGSRQLNVPEQVIRTLLQAPVGEGARAGDGGQGLHALGQVGGHRQAAGRGDGRPRRLAADRLAADGGRRAGGEAGHGRRSRCPS